MDIGPVPKIASVAESAASQRVAVGAAPIRTELPAAKAVQDAKAASPLRDAPRAPALRPVDREIAIDPTTQALLSQVFDRESGDLISQVPDQALLRMKIYARDAVAEIEAKTIRARLELIA